jgi:hypothetical protein
MMESRGGLSRAMMRFACQHLVSHSFDKRFIEHHKNYLT